MTPEEQDKLKKQIFHEDGTVDKEALKKAGDQLWAELDDRYLGLAIELWISGWTCEPVTSTSQIMSWYWRRPPKPGRTKGRLFHSTDQAYNQLLKDAGITPAPGS